MSEEFNFGSLIENEEPEEIKISIPEVKIEEKLEDKPKVRVRRKQLHILNEENLIIFIKQTNKTKSYEIKHRFYNSSSSEIQDLLDKLFKKGLLVRNRNGWIYLKT